MTRLFSLPARCLIGAIRLYQLYWSPLRLPTCRFDPTCSQYAVDALREFGFIRGGVLSVIRLLKCGPWHRGGWDPVPERTERTRDLRPEGHQTLPNEQLRSA